MVGSTVTVLLHVFAGIDVQVTLDDARADEVRPTVPTIEYVFLNVTPGKHTVDVRDVVGFKESAEVVVPPPISAKEPTADGLCIPAAPLGVAVGHTWTLVGPVRVQGDFSESGLPDGASELSSSFTLTAIEDSSWAVGEATARAPGDNQVLVEHSKIQGKSIQIVRDADGDVLETTEEVESEITISAPTLSPVLTLDWDCHRQAWRWLGTSDNLPGGGLTSTQHSVNEKVLSSGATAVLFRQSLTASVPEQDIEITGEAVFGYDKLTGVLVLVTQRSTGTRNGKPFSLTIDQELVSEGTVPIESGGNPAEDLEWLAELILKLEDEPVANPPLSITQYGYQGQTVYFLPQRCCDIFSDLYDADGNIIGHPDGGITGRGDGRVPDFFEERNNERVIWKDQRTFALGLVQVPAPIESVEVLIMESFPPQYSVVVVSGLPNACVSFGGYTLSREDNVTRVAMVNWKSADPEIVCAQVYSTVMTTIPLGPGFESGETYAVEVNDVTETFVAQ